MSPLGTAAAGIGRAGDTGATVADGVAAGEATTGTASSAVVDVVAAAVAVSTALGLATGLSCRFNDVPSTDGTVLPAPLPNGVVGSGDADGCTPAACRAEALPPDTASSDGDDALGAVLAAASDASTTGRPAWLWSASTSSMLQPWVEPLESALAPTPTPPLLSTTTAPAAAAGSTSDLRGTRAVCPCP